MNTPTIPCAATATQGMIGGGGARSTATLLKLSRNKSGHGRLSGNPCVSQWKKEKEKSIHIKYIYSNYDIAVCIYSPWFKINLEKRPLMPYSGLFASHILLIVTEIALLSIADILINLWFIIHKQCSLVHYDFMPWETTLFVGNKLWANSTIHIITYSLLLTLSPNMNLS